MDSSKIKIEDTSNTNQSINLESLGSASDLKITKEDTTLNTGKSFFPEVKSETVVPMDGIELLADQKKMKETDNLSGGSNHILPVTDKESLGVNNNISTPVNTSIMNDDFKIENIDLSDINIRRFVFIKI